MLCLSICNLAISLNVLKQINYHALYAICLVIIEFEFLKLIDYHDITCYMLCGNLVRLSAILYVLEIVLYPLCKGPNNQLSQVHTTSDKIRNIDAIYKCLSV